MGLPGSTLQSLAGQEETQVQTFIAAVGATGCTTWHRRQRHGSTLAVDAANVAIRHHPAQKDKKGPVHSCKRKVSD